MPSSHPRLALAAALATALATALGSGLGVTACNLSELDPPCALAFELEPEPASLYAEPTPCDPLVAASTMPIIQPPAAVGVTADDTLIVIDRIDGGYNRPEVKGRLEPRVLVEQQGVLVRRPGGVGGSQSTMAYLFDSFAVTDPVISGMIRVERKPGYPQNIIPEETSIVVFDGAVMGGPYLEDFFPEGTPLQVMPECTVNDYEVQDLPTSRRIEYVARDDAGNEILVTVPSVDWDVQSCKLFYGPTGAVLERPVTSFARERDGGTTHIAFTIDGVPATLHFVVGCNGPFSSDCEGNLELPDITRTVSIPSQDPGLLVGNTYVCHDQ